MASLQEITDMYIALGKLQEQEEAQTRALADTTGKISRMEGDIADAMATLQMSTVKMSDGTELSLKVQYFGSPAQERMAAIRKLLEAKGALHLIKPDKITVNESQAARLPKYMQKRITYSINTNSLKAWLAEQAANNELDAETVSLFKVHTKNSVTLKRK